VCARAQAAFDEAAVRADVRAMLEAGDMKMGPTLVRLAWHASGTYSTADGTGGSDGATMRFAPESGYGANAGLDIARAALEPIKAKHPGISYADLWVLAAYEAIEAMSGPHIDFRAGRTDKPDGRSCPPDGRLPDANLGAAHSRDIFYRQGFNDQEIAALIGAHCLGQFHKKNSGFSDLPWTYSPTMFTNNFYTLLLEKQWTPKQPPGGNVEFKTPEGDILMSTSDMSFKSDATFRSWCETYAKDEARFFKDFAAAFKKLTENGCKNLEAKSWWSSIFG